MGKFKNLFTNYLENHGDKPLCELPFECQLLAFGMFLGRNASNTVYQEMQDKLYSEMESYYSEELAEIRKKGNFNG